MATADTLLRSSGPTSDTLLRTQGGVAFDASIFLERWKDGAPDSKSTQESDEFIAGAIELLNDSAMVAEFEKNVAQVGTWANEVDEAFDRVTRNFQDLVNRHGNDFAGLANYLAEWREFNRRWNSSLMLSRDVASQHIVILRRFDRVFLDMILHIETNQDRLDVIFELNKLIEEDYPDSAKMAEAFQELSRDIAHFARRLDTYIEDVGVDLIAQAEDLQRDISNLQQQISGLDKQINDARIALAVSGGLLNVIGLIVAGSLLASYQNQRNQVADTLARRQRELAEVNRKQESLAHLKTEIENLRPDIDLICERLLLFAQIWLSVQSQSRQFRDHLEGGVGAETNMRFRREVQLAQETCAPLMAGLERYATEIRPRPVN